MRINENLRVQVSDLPEERNRILCIVSSLQVGDGTLFQIVAGAQPVIISWRWEEEDISGSG